MFVLNLCIVYIGAKYPIPVIGALSFLVIAIPLFIYRRTIWRCIRRQNDPNNERQALNPGNIRNDYAANDNIDGADLRIQPHSSSENRTWARNNSNSARDNYSRGHNRSHNTDLQCQKDFHGFKRDKSPTQFDRFVVYF